LLPLFLAELGNLDHDERMDLVNERDAFSPDPVHTRKLALNILYMHHKNGKTEKAKKSVLSACIGKRGMRRGEGYQG